MMQNFKKLMRRAAQPEEMVKNPRHSSRQRSLSIRTLFLLCLSVLALSAQNTGSRFGATDPAGNSRNLTLFRDEQVYTAGPSSTSDAAWRTATMGFDANLNPTSTVGSLPWPMVTTADDLVHVDVKATAGRILQPDKDNIFLVQRSTANSTLLVGQFSDGTGQATIGPILDRVDAYADFFSVAEGDLDGLYDAKGNYHDEVIVAWMQAETANSPCQSFSVPHLAVLNYNNNDPSHPTITTARIERSDNGYLTTCTLAGYNYLISLNQSSIQTAVPQPNDNIIATTMGDFDGDGQLEIAVAYMRYDTTAAAKTVMTVAIYRYVNDGTTATLSLVNTYDISVPNRSFVATLSLAAGNFDGSGVDQLLVGTANWWGTPDSTGTNYVRGTFLNQPVAFLLVGGQVQGTITNASSSGPGNPTTDFTVSLGKGVYIPRAVTVSGATGKWAAINGTWSATPTPTGFRLNVDSSPFGSFAGQNIAVNVAAPLTQTDSVTIDPYSGVTDGNGLTNGKIQVDDTDKDGRIRVQLAPGLFRFGSNGDYRRRQIAMAWNARPAVAYGDQSQYPDPHLALLEITNDDKIQVTYNGNQIFGPDFQILQSMTMTAGALRGDSNTNDPTWSLFFTGVGLGFNRNQSYPNRDVYYGLLNAVWKVAPDSNDSTKLQATQVCNGKATGDSYQPVYAGLNPPLCYIWGDNATVVNLLGKPFNYMRLPVVAADLNGNSLKLGAPVHYEITKPVKAQFILEQPPQHAAYFDDGSGNGPQVQTISRYPSFNTSMQDSQQRSYNTNEKDHTDWTVGASAQFSASYQEDFGLGADDTGIGEKAKIGITAKASYDYDHVQEGYTTTADSYTVTQQNATGTDDVLIYNSEIIDLWRYRIFGSGADTGDSQKPYAYYDIVLPGASSIVSYPGGRDVDWYQPVHETGNILSYPSREEVCSPSDLGAITVQEKAIFNQVIPLISCTQQYYNGNSSNISLKFDHTSDIGSSTDYTHKVHADVDVSATYTVGAELGIAGSGFGSTTSYGLDVDVHGGADWGHLSTSDDITSASTGITVNSPQGDPQHAYPYYPIFYDTDAGALKVAFGVGDLTASGGGGFWTDYYGQQPDPALNLPARFNPTYSHNNIFNGWAADETIARKKMKGLVIRSPQADDKGYYPLLGSNPHDGALVMFEVRVYNYSISSTPTSPITVQLSVIPMDNKNNEICRSAGGQQPTYTRGGHICPVGDRTIIGNASSGPEGGAQTISLNARENQLTYLKWNTKGFGPQAGTALYRVYVDLISDPKNEIYPPEPPCTHLPCDNTLAIENIVDPGQNNEGWSLVSIEAPAQGLQAGTPGAPAPDAAQLSLGSDTPLLGGPQENFLTASLGRPFPLRLSAFSTAPTPLHSYASIHDGKPGEAGTQMIAAKVVQGLRPDGTTVWHNWTPLALVPHHLYATTQNRNGAQPLGDLLVDVQRSIGDLNGDGRVDRHDLNILARDLGQSVAESACGTACDIDGDGRITQTDSLLISNLCDSQGCAFATSEYVGGEDSPLEPDMRAQRTADLAARTAWLAAHPEAQGILGSTPPVSYGLAAYRDELVRNVGLHSVQHYYKGQLVTTGPLAAWPPTPPAQTALYANPVTREGTEVEVPLVLVNNGTGPISALDLTKLSVQTLAGTGQAAILNSNFSLPSGGLLPGASTMVSVRLQVPTTVRKLKLIEAGSLQSGSSGPYEFSSGQVIFP